MITDAQRQAARAVILERSATSDRASLSWLNATADAVLEAGLAAGDQDWTGVAPLLVSHEECAMAYDAVIRRMHRAENALRWIRMITGLHYFGDAFDPEHMRALGNIAADALSGLRDLPDFGESQAEAQEKARERADLISRNLTEDDETGGGRDEAGTAGRDGGGDEGGAPGGP